MRFAVFEQLVNCCFVVAALEYLNTLLKIRSLEFDHQTVSFVWICHRKRVGILSVLGAVVQKTESLNHGNTLIHRTSTAIFTP